MVANYLPPPSGSGGSNYHFIMVGTDTSDIARIGASVKATNVPSGSTVQVRIAYKDPSGTVTVLGGMDSYSGGTALLSGTVPMNPGGTGNKYFVIAWIDDGSGDYNYAAVKDNTDGKWTIYLVSEAIRNVDIDLLIGGTWMSEHYTSAFLTAFIYDNAIAGADNVKNVTIKNNNPKLHHNTGLIWHSGIPPSGNAIQNIFNNNNALADTIRNNGDFVNLVKTTLNSAKPTVQSFTGWTGPTHTFAIPMNDPELLFTRFYSLDLPVAFGHAAVTSTLYAYVRKSDLELLNLNITGFLYKLYSFDVTKAEPAPLGAEVQAGYELIGEAGHVFEIMVHLNANNYTNVLPFNFS
jgi:hypothetical protein